VPPWTGQAPPPPHYPQGPYPGGPQYPNPSGQRPPLPWQDPNRRGQQPDRLGQRPTVGTGADRPPPSMRTRWSRWLAAGGMATTFIVYLHGYQSLPAYVFGLALGLAMSLVGLWFGVFAQRAASRERRRAPEAVGAILWNCVATFFALILLASTLIFYSELQQYSQCMSGALTISAQTACQNQLNSATDIQP
jgi:hypothetical protein